ncbi:Tyrosine kinase catalytic domain protein [Ceratobasidium sp. AG-Ba]|nr:Tyrosine kinase catalytic domain protein [Ceratobasidium sp. AG-Ba]
MVQTYSLPPTIKECIPSASSRYDDKHAGYPKKRQIPAIGEPGPSGWQEDSRPESLVGLPSEIIFMIARSLGWFTNTNTSVGSNRDSSGSLQAYREYLEERSLFRKSLGRTPYDKPRGCKDVDYPQISSTMSTGEILRCLVNRGSRNLTEELDLESVSQEPLCRGGFGMVYKGKLRDGTPIAIKLLSENVNEWGESRRKIEKRAARECYVWSKLQHPGVHKLLGVAQFRGRIAMISPWMESGSLPMYLFQHPKADRLDLAYQVANSLAYLHLSGTVHGDVKGSNILVSANGTTKLTDFGTTKLQDYTLNFTATTSGSGFSTRYTPPEVLKGGPQTTGSDVFALGMIIQEILTGELPYGHIKNEACVMCNILLGQPPSRPDKGIFKGAIGDKLWLLLMACWATEPGDRPDVVFVRDQLEAISSEAALSN